MKLEVGTKVRWVSAAGVLEGEIVRIVLDLNAAQQTIPWIDIKTNVNTVRLCATDSYLKQMRVEVLQETCLL